MLPLQRACKAHPLGTSLSCEGTLPSGARSWYLVELGQNSIFWRQLPLLPAAALARAGRGEVGMFSTAAGRWGALLVASQEGSWLLWGLAFPLACVQKGQKQRRECHHHSAVLRSPSAFPTGKVVKPFNQSVKLSTTADLQNSSLSTGGL